MDVLNVYGEEKICFDVGTMGNFWYIALRAASVSLRLLKRQQRRIVYFFFAPNTHSAVSLVVLPIPQS